MQDTQQIGSAYVRWLETEQEVARLRDMLQSHKELMVYAVNALDSCLEVPAYPSHETTNLVQQNLQAAVLSCRKALQALDALTKQPGETAPE